MLIFYSEDLLNMVTAQVGFVWKYVIIFHANDSGTRTRKKTKSAEKNLESFYSTLGRLA